MAKSSLPMSLLLFFLLVVVTPPTPSEAAITYTQLRSLLSHAHSLSTRVANLRTSRGDLAGARRARLIADKLESGLGFRFWGATVWSMGWDYLKNYAWRGTASFQDGLGIVTDINELLSSLTELSRMGSDSERVAWIAGNYRNVLRVSNSIFNRLLSVFSKSGPLRELVEILKTEMEGNFLKDCLEVGSNDLKGLVQILKDLGSQYATFNHQEL